MKIDNKGQNLNGKERVSSVSEELRWSRLGEKYWADKTRVNVCHGVARIRNMPEFTVVVAEEERQY